MSNYDWNDLQVGRSDLNHSEKFFSFRHEKHNKSYNNKLNQIDNKENVCKGNNGEYDDGNNDMSKTECFDPRTFSSEPHLSQIKVPLSPLLLDKPASLPQLNQLKISPSPTDTSQTITTNIPIVKPIKISSIGKKERHSESSTATSSSNKPFSVLRYVEIYENKKQHVKNSIIENEKKQRVFVSRPAPKFNSKIAIPEPKKLQITMPITPNVQKRSEEAAARRRQRIDELKASSKPDKRFVRDAKAVIENPFKPNIVSRFLKQQPFNLHVEKRLVDRKQFDDSITRRFEEKKKQAEQDRKQNEVEEVKEFRKFATFKARQNPFSK